VPERTPKGWETFRMGIQPLGVGGSTPATDRAMVPASLRLTTTRMPGRSAHSYGRAARWALVCWAVGLVAQGLLACGGGPSEEDVDRSIREFTLAVSLREEGNVPGAIEHLRVALSLDPDNARALVLLGYIHYQRGDLEAAEQYLRNGLAILVERPDMAATLAEARNMLGVVLIRQERYDESIAVLTQSASDVLNRTPWYAWGNLGLAHYEKGDYPQAVEALSQAVRGEPRFCLGHFQLGRTFFAMERFQEAEEALTRALEADERCGRFFQDAWRLRGETRARLGLREEAITDFERCVELGAQSEAGRACRRFLDSGHEGGGEDVQSVGG